MGKDIFPFGNVFNLKRIAPICISNAFRKTLFSGNIDFAIRNEPERNGAAFPAFIGNPDV